MDIKVREFNKGVIFDLDGNLDLYSAPNLKQLIKKQMDANQFNIIINLEKIFYIDSSGVGVLIASLSELKKVGGELKLVHVGEEVGKIFKLTKLMTFFEIYETKEKAIESYIQ